MSPRSEGAARGGLDARAEVGWGDAAVCVVMASGGYPRAYETGKPITGLDALAQDADIVVFHAGTGLDSGAHGPGGYATQGGRVLGVTARGSDVAEARARAYAAVAKLDFEAAHYRRDIADRALGR